MQNSSGFGKKILFSEVPKKTCNKLPTNNVLPLKLVKPVLLSKFFLIIALSCILHIYLHERGFHCMISFIWCQLK